MNQTTSVEQNSSTKLLSGGKIDPWVVLFEAILILLTHWKLLIIGPLMAAAVAYAGSFLLPKSYRSYAYVGPLDEAAAKRSAALISLAAGPRCGVAQVSREAICYDDGRTSQDLRIRKNSLQARRWRGSQIFTTLRS